MSTEPIWKWLVQLLQSETGFHQSHTRWSTLSYRLGELAVSKGYVSAESYLAEVQASRDIGAREELVETLLNYETRFFRDARLFDLLRDVLLPDLIASEPTLTPKSVNIWSAACATGQEPYSLALLWETHFAARARLELSASDLSRQALDKARQGVYPAREVERQVHERYRSLFHPHPDGLQINASLQRRIQFRNINLIQAWPELPVMDLVLMRNVLIYLEPANKARILTQMARRLRPGGYLILGITESLVPLPETFRPVHLDRAGGCFIRR